MIMELEIQSKEFIRPSSSSTYPDDLKTFKLSVLDQLSPLFYTPLIFFYKPDKKADHSKLASKLKSSLSETLTKFYLLAARIENDQIICNDEGAIFLEARVGGGMSEFLMQPRFELLNQLIPCCSELYPQVVVQFISFGCGGVAVAACFLHKIIDGGTLSAFIRSWAAVATGSTDEQMGVSDYRVLSSLFPPKELPASAASWLDESSPLISRGKICSRRFVFEAPAILDLKIQVNAFNPTGVEVVTAFIWKYAIKAARDRSGSQRPSALTHAVNLRRRMAPPLAATTVGNIIWTALAYYTSPNPEIEFNELVNLVRASFEEIDSNFIQKMMGEEGFHAISRSLMQTQELYSKKLDAYRFASWRNMGLNQVDFGWGKPLWVTYAGNDDLNLKNIVILKETISGDGIETWVILDEAEMNLLETNQEFLAFASLNPSILLA